MLTKFLRCRAITAIALALILGMLAARIGVVGRAVWLCASAAAFAGTAIWRRGGRFALLLLGFLCLGGLLMSSAQKMPAVPERSEITIHGYIADEPVWQEEKGRAVLTVSETSIGKVRLYVYGEAADFSSAWVGDEITAHANIWKNVPEDMSTALWRQGIGYCLFADAAQIKAADKISVERFLAGARKAVSERIDLLFPRSSALVKALVMGDRAEVAEEQNTNFSRAGVAHLLAVSGLHVSMIAAMLDWLLRKLRIPGTVVFVLMAIALSAYAVFVGMRASVVRAVLMYILPGFARRMGRPRDGLASMSAAAVAQLIVKPLWLLDAGFILSYSAVAGIMMITQPLSEGMEKRVHGKILRAVLNSILMSYGAVIGTLPAVVVIYGWVASYSILLNLIAIPLATYAMYGCVIALGTSLILPNAGVIVGIVPDLLLEMLDRIAALVAGLPGNTISLRPWTVSYIILFILVVAIGSRYLKVSRKWTIAAVLLIPVMLVAYEAGMRLISRTEVKVVFLDANQADSAAIHAQGNLYFVDVGDTITPANSYAAHNGGRVEAVFLSHPHSDHAGGITALIKNVDVGTVYIPDGWYGCEQDEEVTLAMEEVRKAGIRVRTLAAGDTVRLSEDVSIEVLSPVASSRETDGNALSMVLHLKYGKVSALFTGDLPSGSELEDMPDIDVLKVAHHGSAGSTSMMFLYETTPSVSVISVGTNSYGHPTEETLDRLVDAGTQIYRTDQNGNIEIVLLRDGYVQVNAEKEGES